MKFIDLFCGIGTIRMGFEQAGHECVYSVEWDKHKRRMYSVIFGKEPEGQDIRSVSANDLPRSDCWCFGAPCQDFSIAGKREGLEGDRSSLVREVFRLVRETKEEHRPKYLLYENVKGMLSSNKGFDFLEILIEMESLGYDTIEYSLLNSKNFGVPQNRERVFTIGHFGGRGGRKVFPIEGGGSQTLKQIIPGSDAQRVYGINGLGRTLKAEGGGQGAKKGLYLVNGTQGGNRQPKILVKEASILRSVRTEYGKAIRGAYESGEIQESRHNMTKLEPRTDGISNTISTVQKDNLLLVKEATKKGYAEAYEGDSINLAVPGGKTRKVRVGKGIANTLDTSCNQATLIQGRIRRLTPRECMRLQGVSDEVTDKLIAAGISDTQMYRGAGDACTTTVIYEIAKRMI